MKSPRTLSRIHSGLAALATIALLAVSAAPAAAQAQTIKIGLLYDHSGPFSAAGSLNCWRGAKMMIDYINERGGVLGKYKIVQDDLVLAEDAAALVDVVDHHLRAAPAVQRADRKS